ncbi:3-ketoacyl-ACP reductase [Pseudoclavibacter endophyticus]|uniref:SDR family oxidoreductase n=1 Tax=Pseudoclavibacter endophyticus TaxID=1778590 RepID=A0A6H9WSN0_9MICO|nr:SDR family oxidoreductase [Pseudoclavibacter endophyticus]KAB1649705.1 SDR family oxidoreductase [Pseudoclavibacter endophyticus]GGA60414.1 3-ketoacyl-ACP reductase [Pseudoclavibacter endophyticus]
MRQPLIGRTAVVTGVSRRRGIGAAVARRLADMGANLVVHHHRAHDVAQPWGADDLDDVLADLHGHLVPGAHLHDIAADLTEQDAPRSLIEYALDVAGPLDILVCVHARSGGDGSLAEITAEELDGHWAADARSVLLATQAFAQAHEPDRAGGRVVWMTSGQQQGPMPGEVAYAAAKAALAGVTRTVADELVEQGIVLNTVNPGPVNTGFLDPGQGIDDATLASLKRRFPSGRFGVPEDPARLIGWLVSDDAEWVVGQVIDSEGGFRR